MKYRHIFLWLLALVMLCSASGALAEFEEIINEDGSSVHIYSENGVVRSKDYYDSENFNYKSEFFDNNGALNGYLMMHIDAEGKRVSEYYDPAGSLTSMNKDYLDADNNNINENYDENRTYLGYIKSFGDAEGKWHSEEYDSNNVLRQIFVNYSEGDGHITERYSPDHTLISRSRYEELTDGSSVEKTYNADGQLINESTWNEGGAFHAREYYDDGTLKSETTDSAAEGFLVREYGENGVIKSEYSQKPDGSYVGRDFDAAGNVTFEYTGKASTSYEYRNDVLYQIVTNISSDTGDQRTVIKKDASGQLISERQEVLNEDGAVVQSTLKNASGEIIGQETYDPDTDVRSGWSVDYNGVKTVYSNQGNAYVEEKTAPDGTVSTTRYLENDEGVTTGYETYMNGELVSITTYDADNPDNSETRDLNGHVIATIISEKRDDGGISVIKKNADGMVIEEYNYDENMPYPIGFKMTADGGKEQYSLNEFGDRVVEIYNAAGQLKEVLTVNEDGIVIAREIKKAAVLPPQPAYTWFPNNTVSTMGLSFREVKPELTDKWYHFTPVDLSRDGEQVIPLVASNAFIVGRVYVNVKGDEVTVTYMARGQGSAGTFRVHSEFLTFFPDLASVTEVEPEKLGEGFKFGEPISIEKDLKGDTRVLLFVRNVVTYRDYYTGDLRHARYWPNLKQHKDYREMLQGLMD